MVAKKTRRGGSGGLHKQKKRKTRRGGRRLANAKQYEKLQNERNSNEVLKRMGTLEQKIMLYETDPTLDGYVDHHQVLVDQYVEYENKSVTK